MKTIYKYSLKVTDNQIIHLPKDSQILDIQAQEGEPKIWVLVDTEKEMEIVTIDIYGTGHPFRHPGTYIGTFQLLGGRLVFHAFKRN